MDDVIILSDSKEELAELKAVIEEFLKDFLHLDLNKRQRYARFGLAWILSATGFGATHKKLKKQTARRMIRNTKRLCERALEGEDERGAV